jgi:hypothetical protein
LRICLRCVGAGAERIVDENMDRLVERLIALDIRLCNLDELLGRRKIKECACFATSPPSKATLTFARRAPKSNGCQLSRSPPPLLHALREGSDAITGPEIVEITL